MYTCSFCGYHSDILTDFEEDFTLHLGYWCPYCDGFTYFKSSNTNHSFKLLLEDNCGTEANKVKVDFPVYVSPLRYPGGKSKLVGQILSKCNALHMENFVEPFAGGASVGLSLLLSNKISQLYLNDLDFGVYALFQCIKDVPWVLIERVKSFTPSHEAFIHAQRFLKNDYDNLDIVDAAWYLLIVNRLAFSGIAKANCLSNPASRWNKDTLIRKIENIHAAGKRIHVSCEDACSVIENAYWKPNTTIFIDPPYVGKGHSLYLKSYKTADHYKLAFLLDELFKGMPGADILLTYDNDKLIKESYLYPETEIISRKYSISNN